MLIDIPKKSSFAGDMMDIYTYKDSECLKNKFNVKDTAILHGYERLYVTKRLVELNAEPIKGSFDLVHLRRIHHHLFQDIYAWAGKLRKVDIGKEDVLTGKISEFCRSERIEGFAEDICKNLKNKNYFLGMNEEAFAQNGAELLGELNLLHPFREGNGRTQREFLKELGRNAGWELALGNVGRERMIQASIQAMRMDYTGFRDIIRDNMRSIDVGKSKEYREYMAKIMDAPPPDRKLKDQELYQAFAKIAITEVGNWQTGMDKAVFGKMMEAGLDRQTCTKLMTYSLDLIGLNAIDKRIRAQDMSLTFSKNREKALKNRSISR